MEKLHIIDKMKFFEELTESEKEAVARIQLRVFKYDAQAVIVKQSAKDTNFYIMIKGTATVVGSKGEPLAILKSGDVFGEISFLASRPHRSASVVANNEVIVMRVDRESFETLDIVIRDKLKDKLIQVLVDRLVSSHDSGHLSISSSCDWAKS